MNSHRFSQKLTHFLAAGIAFMSLAVGANAQVRTESTTTHGPATQSVSVDRGEVVYVSGPNLVLKKDDGTIVHFAHASESATVDGKQVAIDDLKPGMKLERTITTTTTPMTVKTVETVTGKVFHNHPPLYVILTLEDGTNHRFELPADHKVTVDGREVSAWGLRKGLKVSATRVTEAPSTVVAQETKFSGSAPAPVAFQAHSPVFFAVFAPARELPVLADATPATLPETGSSIPLYGLLGVLAFGSALGLRAIRING